jgi:hypothetical protein
MKSGIPTNQERIDVTGSLADPSFWALQMSTSPQSAWDVWDLTKREVDELFVRFFRRHWDDGVWPFVRLPLGGSRYLEIEYAEVEEMEEQDRVWIGSEDGRRALLGFESPHFSFPTLRMEELLMIANRLNEHRSAPLLLLRGAYLTAADKPPKDAIRTWLQLVPAMPQGSIPDIVADLVKNVVPEVRWRKDPALGWINNGVYSQRNPKSEMSLLEKQDFQFIQWFFEGL